MNIRSYCQVKSDAGFIIQMAKNDFKVKYAGAYLGLIWSFIQPIVTILIYWFVFQIGFKTTPINDSPYIIWFISGIIPWFFISDCIVMGMNSVLDYGYIVKKVIFKVNVLPLVKIVVAAFIHIVFIILLLVVTFFAGKPLDLYCLQIIYYSIAASFLCIGTSYLFSALVPFLKDLTQVISIIMQFGFWITPIVWNYTVLPQKYLWIIKINPAFYIVQGYRDSLIYNIWFWERPVHTAFYWITAILLMLLGTRVFKKLRPHFADVL